MIKGGKGRRSPTQPNQKQAIAKFNYNQSYPDLPSHKILKERHDKNPKWFDEGGDKIRLHTLFAKDNRTSIPLENAEPTYDDL